MKKQLLIVIAFTLILFSPIKANAGNSTNLDINSQDEFGATLLMQAVNNENIDNVKWLLESGANPNIKDKAGVAALHFAAKKGNVKIIELLIKHGANVNAKDIYGFTPYMRAVSHDNKNAASILYRKSVKKYHIPVPKIKPSLIHIIPVNKAKPSINANSG